MRLRASHLVWAASFTGTCTGPVLAWQPVEPDSGPVIVGERKAAWNFFELARYEAGFEFLGSTRLDTLKQDGQPNLEDKQNIAKETLDLLGEGFFGHKNLIDLTGRFRFQLENQWISSQTQGTDEAFRNLYFLYDINAHILGASLVPTDVYARHDQQTLNRDFGTSLTQTTTEYGAIANYQSEKFPTTLQLAHNEQQQNDLLGQFNYQYKRDTLAAQTTLVLSDDHRLEGRYTFDSVSEDQQNVYSDTYTRNDLTLNDTYVFGDRHNATLRSYFRYFSQSGLFAYENMRWEEQLRLVHTPTLESTYDLSANRQTNGGVESDTYRGTANVTHKLFDSVVTNANIGLQRFTTLDFTSDDKFIGGSIEYTKKIAPGRLDITVGVNFNNQVNSEQGSTIAVFNQPYVWTGSVFFTIQQRNVVSGSLRLTGPGGFPTYQEGTDYTVIYYPDRVEVYPIPGQGIAVGSVVLANYDIGPEPGNTINTISTGTAVRYTIVETWLQGLGIHGSYRTGNSSVDSANPSAIVIDNYQDFLYGLDYRRWGVTLSAEQEHRQSNVNPYDTIRLQALYDLRTGVDSVLNFDVTDEQTSYQIPANDINLFRAGVRWIQQLGPTLDLDSRVIYRNETNQLAGNSDGIDARVELRWHYRQTSAYITFGDSISGTPTSEQTSRIIEVGFRREF